MKIQTLIAAIALSAASAVAQTMTNFEAILTNQNPSCLFTFDNGSYSSSFGASVTLTVAGLAGQFAEDIFGNSSNAVYFLTSNDAVYDANEATDKIVNGGGIPTNNSTATGSLVIVLKMTDPGGVPTFTGTGNLGHNQLNIFSAGGQTGPVTNGATVFPGTNAFKLFVENETTSTNDPGALKFQFGDSTTILLASNNIVWDSWYYFAATYNESYTIAGQPNTNKAKWYLGLLKGNSPLASGITTNSQLSVAGSATDLLIGATKNNSGAIGSSFLNPGVGEIDAVGFWNRELTPAEIQSQFGALPNLNTPPASVYQNLIASQSPRHYFKLDGDSVDSINPGIIVMSTNVASWGYTGGYDWGYFLTPHSSLWMTTSPDALYWNNNLLNGGGAYNGNNGSGQGTVTFLFRSLGSYINQGQKFLFSAGGNSTTTNGLALFLEGVSSTNAPESLKLRFGGTSKVILFTNQFLLSTWYYFAMNYNEGTQVANWWLAPLTSHGNGPMTSGSFTAEPGSLAGSGSVFVIGNNDAFSAAYRNSTPRGNGQIDEVAIWNRILSGTEITDQFNALAPLSIASPVLAISLSGAEVLVSWPLSAGSGFTLLSNTNLATTNWVNAGSPSMAGTNYVVTNVVSSDARFFRLSK